MKVAVIGSGISGLSSAYFLSKKYKVDLYEKEDHFGGHSFTYDIKEGDKIIKGDRVLVIEAMKMETTINVEKSGTIQKIYVGSGDNVETKDLLIEIK